MPAIFITTTVLLALGTLIDFDACDGTGGLKHVVNGGVVEELTDLGEHANVALEGWTATLKPVVDISAETQSYSWCGLSRGMRFTTLVW